MKSETSDRQSYDILTILEVGPVLSGGEVHFDVVQGFALAQVVVIGGGEEAGAVAPDDGLQVTAVDVEGERFESVHISMLQI